MRQGRTAGDVIGGVEDRVKRISPPELAFVLTLTGGVVARCRRLRRERDKGGVSIETAIIVAVLVVAALAVAGVLGVLWRRYRDDLQDTNRDNPGTGDGGGAE